MTKICTGFVLAAATISLAGCQVQKSANPLSPAIAGAIEGVVITNPNLLEPGQDWEMKSRDQPIRLMIQNATTNGARPLKYAIQIASDAEFKNVVFARTAVEPGGDGFTRLQLPDNLAAGTYWWRARAEDGANIGQYSPVKSFQVLAAVVLSPPIPSEPANGSTLSSVVPEFKVKAGARSGVTSVIDYVLEVSNNSSFTSIAAVWTLRETVPETRFALGVGFPNGRTLYWRVRAIHRSDVPEQSNWSNTQTFRTPDVPAPGPSPTPEPSPSPGGGSNPGSCNSSQGSDIADCIESRYPQYLVAGVSLSKRRANTEFLRNKLIEHAKCRGLDVGLNLKRGGPEISVDFIAWRRSGRVEGVDIVSGWDDTGRRLSMSWHTYGPPNYGHPYYKDYGPVSCN